VGLPTIDAPCFLCGGTIADPLWTTPDRAFAVPGIYTVARCRRCGFLYQKPRVDDAHLAECYPDHYPRHQEPSPRIPFMGSPGRIKAARWALSSALGYAQFRDGSVGLLTRLRARRLARKIRWDCPPWTGQGRYLDIGCGSGNTATELDSNVYQSYVGVDISEAALNKARKRSEAAGRQDKNHFECSDFMSYVATGKFDIILFRESMYHVPLGQVKSTLERYSAYLKDGGVFIVRLFAASRETNESKYRPTAMLSIMESEFDLIEKGHYEDWGRPTVIVFRPKVRVKN